MADDSLAALARGEDVTEGKICPFCTGELLPKAQKCKFCGGWVVSVETAAEDWRQEEASPGQRNLLKRLRVARPRGLSRGAAADLLGEAHRADPAAFAGFTGLGHEGGKRPGGRGGIGFVILLLLLGASGWLHVTGRLRPVIDCLELDRFIPRKDTATEGERVGRESAVVTRDDGGTEVGREVSLPPESGTTVERADTPGVVDTTDAEYVAMAKHFKAKQPGEKVVILLRAGQPVSGVVKAVLPDNVVLLRALGKGEAEVTYARKDIGAVSRALFWEADFVAYGMARRSSDTLAQSDARELSRRAEEYRDAMARRAGEQREQQRLRLAALKESHRRKGSVQDDATDVRRGDMSMKEWMETHNTDNEMLRARQERVRQYESGKTRQ